MYDKNSQQHSEVTKSTSEFLSNSEYVSESTKSHKQSNDVITSDYLLSLSEEKKKKLIQKVFRVVRQVANKQLMLLSNLKKGDQPKTQRHLYFFTIIESFWKDADFCLALGKNKYRSFAIYPARTMMEKALKIIWLSNQKAEIQDLITEKELLRQCYDLYQMYEEPEYIDHYNKINTGNFPDILTVKRAELQAFPNYEELCLKSKLRDANTLYHSYRYLSGLPHGDLLYTYMFHQMSMDKGGYRWSLMIATRFAIEMIKITDFHLLNATQSDVTEAIKKSDQIIKGVI